MNKLERDPKKIKENADLIIEAYNKQKEYYEYKAMHVKTLLKTLLELRASIIDFEENEPQNPLARLLESSISLTIESQKQSMEMSQELLKLLEMAMGSAEQIIKEGVYSVNLNSKKKANK